MTLNENWCSMTSGFWGTGMKLPLIVALISLIITGCNRHLEDPYPKEIRDVKLGASKTQVIDMTKGSGKNSEEAVPKRNNRVRLTWALDAHPNFEAVSFDFTELNRLYAVRLVLKPGRDAQERSLKDALVQKYHISTEFLGKMRVGDDNVMLYVGQEGVTASLLVFTNMVNGRKTYEIFDRSISGDDFREYSAKHPTPKSKKKGASTTPAAAPEDQSKWGKPQKEPSEPAKKADTPEEPQGSRQETK